MIEGKRLWMFVIYQNPADYPNEFVCRRHWVESGLTGVDADLFARGATLECVRSRIPEGEVSMPRSPLDDPAIVETWL